MSEDTDARRCILGSLKEYLLDRTHRVVNHGPAQENQERSFLPLDALHLSVTKKHIENVLADENTKRWRGAGNFIAGGLERPRKIYITRKTVATDAEHLEAMDKAHSLLELVGRSRLRHILSILLFVGQFGCAVPIGAYRPLRQGDSEILSSEDRRRVFTPGTLHIDMSSHIQSSLLHPGPALFVLSAVAFGALITMTYRFHRFAGTKDIVFKGVLTLGPVGGALLSWKGIEIPPILVPWTVSIALLCAIVIDGIQAYGDGRQRGDVSEIPEEPGIQGFEP